MTLILQVNGINYENFENASISKTIEALSGVFSFSTSISNFKDFPIKNDSVAQILTKKNQIPLITGFIEDTDFDSDISNSVVNLSGRDKTADVIDSTVFGNVSFAPNMTLKAIIDRLLKQNGIDIEVIDNVNPKKFSSSEFVDAEPGQNLYELIELYAKKRAVILRSDGLSRIILTRGGENIVPRKLIRKKNNNENNILSSRLNRNTQNRFNKYRVLSQMSLKTLKTLKSIPKNIASQIGEAIDDEVRSSRIMVMVEDTNNAQTSQERAVWEANIRKANSVTYTCSVQGFFADEDEKIVWEPNRFVYVQDEDKDVDAKMLIKRVDMSFSIDRGSVTTLELVDKDAYTLKIKQDKIDLQTNKLAPNA